METALVQAATLKPEIRLERAVLEFQRDLSDEQKVAFSAFQDEARSDPPRVKDVMQVTANMKRHMAQEHHRLVPRFTNFLEGVQRFASIGDVIVGGSQNLIACGVWSLVRLSLTVLVASTTYFEKLSNLFMEIGRFAPRFQSLIVLYPRSAHLRDHLCEYYTEVVKLCHEILRHSKKSTLGQIASSTNDGRLQRYKSNLEGWAVMIRDDVNGLMATSIELEREESSRFRSSLLSISKTTAYVDQQRRRTKILKACSRYDHLTAWKQARKRGTTSSFKTAPPFDSWLNSSVSRTLVYRGILGSGKTVLLANMVEEISAHLDERNAPVVHFFCRHDIRESLKCRTVVGSLARQILSETDWDVDKARQSAIDKAATTEGVLSLLRKLLKPSTTIYCLVDGLEECFAQDRDDIVEFLSHLQASFRVLVCRTARTEPGTLSRDPENTADDTDVVTIPVNNPEINDFIESELRHCLESGKLNLGDPTMIIDIADALKKGSQGMFLWAALQIQVLCTMRTDDALRTALNKLPKGLAETYSRIHKTYCGSDEGYQKKTLQLTCAAYRPLTTEEMREALSVTPEQTSWNPAQLINDVYAVFESCGPLITVDEEDSTVHFVHHSFQEFLADVEDNTFHADPYVKGSLFPTHASRLMNRIVMTYLNYDTFATQLSRVAQSGLNVKSAPLVVLDSTLGSAMSRRMLALSFLSARKSPDINIERVIGDHLGKVQVEQQYHFKAYADAHWHQHAKYFWEDDTLLWMLRRAARRGVCDINRLSQNSYIVQGRQRVFKDWDWILHNDASEIDYQWYYNRWAWASKHKHDLLSDFIFETGRIAPRRGPSGRRNAISA